MARSFNLTAEINLRAPGNLKTVVAEIRRELGTVSANVNLKIDPKAAKSVSGVKSKLDAVNSVLVTAKNNTDSLNASLSGLSSALSSVGSAGLKGSGAIKVTAESAKDAAKNIKIAASGMEEFGKQSFLAIKRFAAFSFVTTGIYSLVNAINSGFAAFINFDKELVRLQQVTGKSASELKVLEKTITELSTNLGISSENLTQVAVTLAQAGLTANETRVALAALAKTELAPSFDSLAETTEGAIAALRQFDLQAGDLESALGSINSVAAAFAVEADDLIAAIQRTGGVFAAASKGVSEGTDSLNEFLAIFTSVRQTTRESAETIATGLRTIFTRIQRARTIDQLREFGIELTDLEGKFVGPFEAVKRLSEGLKLLDPRDIRFSSIVEELGGFRQIGKVIPLIQQFSVAQEALKVAQKGQGSLADAQVIAQKSLANQLAKVREQFLAFIRDVGKSEVFQSLFKLVVNLTSGLISLASAFKPILPILAIIGAVKGVKAVGDFATGFFGAASKGSSRGAGESLGATVSGSKDKERAEATAKASEAIRANTSALTSLTTAVEALTVKIGGLSGGTTLSGGGKVLGFNRGGVVPGSGKGDKVPALLEPGEVVMSNNAVNKYGRGNLVRMNRYAAGGIIDIGDNVVQSNIIPKKQTYTFDKDAGVNFRSGSMKFSAGDKFNFKRENQDIDVSQYPNKRDPAYRKYQRTVAENKPRDRGLAFEGIVNKQFKASFESSSSSDEFSRLDGLYEGNLAEIRSTSSRLPDSILSRKVVSGALLSQSPAEKRAAEYLQSSKLTGNNDTINFGKVYVFQDTTNLDNISNKEGQKQRQLGVERLYNGGKIQKFKGGSRGGIDWKSLSQGRGKEGARGARDIIEPISSETYLKWAKGIYDEYDADPSLVMAIGAGGERVPPEIALANKLLTQYAFETGGAGLAVGKRFVRTPKERISDELRPYLIPDPSDPNEFGFFEDDIRKFGRAKILSKAATAKLGRQSALEAVGARMEAYTNAESAISSFKESGALDVDPSIMGYLIQSIKNPDNLPLEPKELAKLKKKLTKPNLDAFDALVGPDKIPVGVQGQRTKLSEVFGAILKTYGSDTSDLEIDNIIRGVGSRIQDKKFGGMIQKFMSGSVGGIMEETLPSDLEGLIEEIAKIGGTTALYGLVSKPEISDIIKNSGVFPRPTAKQIVDSSWLRAKTPDLYGDRSKYIAPLQEIIKRARPKFNEKQSGIQAQLLRNVQAASGQGYKFGLASIYGPNGELGYSSTSNAKEIEGPDGTKYLTQIIRKSLPERFLDAVRTTSQDISGIPARAAERLQYADIFGTGGPLAFDFDETLVKGSDIPDKNPADYSDLNKVQEALKNAELTLLGKELSRRINEYPQLLDGLRVLTARPQSNAPYLAATLARLGLPIPESKITGVSGGLNKVNNLSELETLIDDNLENIQSVIGGGKRAIPYSEPRQPDLSQAASRRSIQVMEGYALEEMVKSLGLNISSDDADPLRPIDYPNGLGSYARYWDMPPNIPTDTKRTNSSSAVNRLFDEAARFYAANFAFGGKADGPSFDEVRQKIIDKYPEIDFRISKRRKGSGFGYNLMGALKSTGGLSGSSGLNFQQPTNLKQLQEYSDKLAAKLMNPEQLAVGGLADATDAMQGLMSGLYGNRGNSRESSKTQKNFGRIALRDSGSRIQATYMKEGQAGQDRSGQVIADKVNNSLYAVQSSAATKGYGPKLYDIVMEAATAAGGMLTSDRRTVSDAAKGVWAYYFNNRSDVKKTPLDPENWVSNSRLLDEKLYGPPDTWPPFTDPAWILQTAYSKAPNLINTPDVVRVDPIQKAIANNEPYLPDMLNRGGFASGGTIPAMVSNGEAFIPPKLAKKIGYAKLDRMNQADRNGMKGFAGGGVSVFSGPGSGTSDSIGPIGLPQGSYVIREKATKALGLSRGGSVGNVQRFALGGTANEQDYFSIRAKQAGQSVEVFSKTIIYAAKSLATELKESMRAAQTELKAGSIELARIFKDADPKTSQGAATRKDVIDKLTNQIKSIDPNRSDKQAKTLAMVLTSKLGSGQDFDAIISSNTELKAIMERQLTNQEAQLEALRKVSEEKGLSPQIIESVLGDRLKSGQDNNISRVIDFFGGPLKVTTRSLLLAASAFEEGAKYIYGAEKLSAETRGVLGGIRGGAQGAAVVAEMDIGANANELGKFLESFGGRLGNVGAALQKFSGGIQAGAIAYAAVSGAIKGFAEAFKQAKLEQELLKVSLAADKTTEAFRRLEKTPTATNATLAQQALGQEMESMEGLRRTAAVDIQGRRSLETARSLDFTGITGAVSGEAQEKDARKAFFDASARRFEQFGTLGERRLNEVNPKEIEKAVADANRDDTVITRLAKELEDLKDAPVKDEAAIKAKEGEIDTAQQAKAENLFRKSQRFGQIAALEGEQEALRQFYLNQAQTEEEKNERLKALNGRLGNTDKERADNQEKAINAAKRLAAAEAETELRTKLLSDATQKLSLQTENLLRTYAVASAMLQRFSESIDLIKNSAEATASALEGRAQIGNVDRTNENILSNIEGYSLEEVRAAAVQTGQLAGGGLGGQTLQNQVLSAKVLQESLPQALATTGSEDVGEVVNKLEDAFSQAGVEFSEPIKQQLKDSLAAEVAGREGVSFAKLAQESDIVANLLKQTEAGLKAAQEFQKRYNDALATAIELQNGYAQALQQSIDFQIKAAEIRSNAQIDLKETLGQRVTSRERNAAFDTRIRTLTSTNVIPGGTTDPNQIFQQLIGGVAGQAAQQEELTRRKQDFAAAPTEANKARVAEQMQAMAKQNVAINNSRKALEELANDGSKAANALKDLQELDRISTGATNFTKNVLTASGDELGKINKQLLAFTKFRSGQATGRDVNNLQFRQDVFAGGDLIKSVLPKEIAEQLDAKLSLDMLRATPGGAAALGAVVGQGPQGEPITLESALSMKAGGRDPVQEKYIKAYQDAVNVQATAAEKLGLAAEEVAKTFNDKMLQVLSQIQQQLPSILEQSVTAGMSPAVAAAYKEMNVAVKEREALDVTQAASMGLDATGFNAVSTAYDAVETSRKRTEDLVKSQATAQGYASVEDFKTMAREKYQRVLDSEPYKASVNAQRAAERDFGKIATAAGLNPEAAAEEMTRYRTSKPYVAATTRIKEKEEAFRSAQAGPQPEKPEGTKPLETTPADTAAKEAERQKQQSDDDFKSGVLSFGGHVAAFFAAVTAFSATVALSGGGGGGGLLQRFFGRGGAGTPAVGGGAGVPRPMGAPGSIPGMGAPAAGAPTGAPGAGGGWLSFLGKALAAAEIGRGAYVGATADTTTNRELTEGWMGETVGTGFNALTGALTGNTGQSQLATLAGIDENASYAQGAAGNLLGSAEAAGRGAAIGYQFGGPTGALVGAIAGLAGDVAKNGALLVQAIGDVADQTQKNADAEAKIKRQEEALRTSMNATNAGRFGEQAGAALSQLSPAEQIRARDEANLRIRLKNAQQMNIAPGDDDKRKLQDLGEDTTRWQSLDDLIAYLQNEAATSEQSRARIVTEEGFFSNTTRGADSPEFLSAVDALVASQSQSADSQAKTAKMADEATKPGSIYTHDVKTEGLLGQLVSLMGGEAETQQDDSKLTSAISQFASGAIKKISDPASIADAGKQIIGGAITAPEKLASKSSDIIKSLLNPKELIDSITQSLSAFSLSDIITSNKGKIATAEAEGITDKTLAIPSLLTKLIPSSLLEKLGLSPAAEITSESCECKLLAQILAVLQKCCPGGTPTITPTGINAPIPAPVPPGVNTVPVIQQPNVVPQVVVQPQRIGPPQGAVGLEPRPEIALQQAETQMELNSATQPQITQAIPKESVKLDEDRQKVIDYSRKNKQKEAEKLKKQIEAAKRNIKLNKAGGASGEKSAAILADKEAQLALVQQDLAYIDEGEAEELEEVRKNKQLRANIEGKQIQYTVEKIKPQTSTEQKKSLSPYEAQQKARRSALEADKKSKRQAYLSRFRPEVRERMMTDDEKAARDAARIAAQRVTQEGTTAGTVTPRTPQQQIRQKFIEAATTTTSTTSQPVPTPLQTTQTPQYTAQTVAADQGATATPQQYTLSLDPASLKAFTDIQSSFTAFGSYVAQLANIRLPDKIEITGGGNYTMQVNITGAAAMEMLQTETKKLAETFVVEEIKKLKDQLNKVFPSEFKASGSGGETSGSGE